MKASVALLLLSLAGCGATARSVEPGSPELYGPNPPLCRTHATATFCSGVSALRCRLDTLVAEHDGPCANDSECRLVEAPTNCIGYGGCGALSVLSAKYDAFLEAAVGELEPWCQQSNCNAAVYCNPRDSAARCVEGRCQATHEL